MKQKKQRKFTHIKKAERLEMSILLNKEYGIRDIAKALKRDPGAISREIANNSVNGAYDPKKANHKACVKRKYSKYQGMKIENNKELRDYVEKKIKQDWSPEQIAGRIKEIDKDLKRVSYQGIYKFIYSPYGRKLERYLRYKNKKRRHKGNKSSQIQNRTFIDERPEITNKKERYGDWEGDLIVSNKQGKGVLLTLYERKSQYVVIKKILSRKTHIINQKIYETTGGFIAFNSLTLDNDISFSKHKELSAMIKAPVYFCHAYHSWEKGGVENINGLIRQYIPKGSNISQYSDEDIWKIEDKLNNRPRKGLSFKTPLEVMSENNQFKSLDNFGIIRLNKKSPSVAIEG